MKKNIDKKALYEKIMTAIVPEVKKAIDEDWKMWLKNNPSGFDHHDPEQTNVDKDFDSLYTELMDAINGRTIDFVKADGMGVTLDTVVDDKNLRVDVIYPDGMADTNAGNLDLKDILADEDDLYTLIDLVNDYSDEFVEDMENMKDDTAEEFLTDETLTEDENIADPTIYEIASSIPEDDFVDMIPNYVTCEGVKSKFQKTFIYTVRVDDEDVENFEKWLAFGAGDATVVDWRIADEDNNKDLKESVEADVTDNEDEEDKDMPRIVTFWDHNYGEICATRCFNPDYNTDKSYWECADEDGTVLCELWTDTFDEDELSIEFEKEMEMHDDDLWMRAHGFDDEDEFDLDEDKEEEDEFEDYEQ